MMAIPHPDRYIRPPPPPPPEPQIEGLVLHGLAAPHAVSLGPEVRRALLRMFQERGAPPGAVPGMAVTLARGLRAGPDEETAALAARVAEAVYTAMSHVPQDCIGAAGTAGHDAEPARPPSSTEADR